MTLGAKHRVKPAKSQIEKAVYRRPNPSYYRKSDAARQQNKFANQQNEKYKATKRQ